MGHVCGGWCGEAKAWHAAAGRVLPRRAAAEDGKLPGGGAGPRGYAWIGERRRADCESRWALRMERQTAERRQESEIVRMHSRLEHSRGLHARTRDWGRASRRIWAGCMCGPCLRAACAQGGTMGTQLRRRAQGASGARAHDAPSIIVHTRYDMHTDAHGHARARLSQWCVQLYAVSTVEIGAVVEWWASVAASGCVACVCCGWSRRVAVMCTSTCCCSCAGACACACRTCTVSSFDCFPRGVDGQLHAGEDAVVAESERPRLTQRCCDAACAL